jgi:hypothetical protein
MPLAAGRTVRFELLRGTLASWPDLLAQAAEIATRQGPERLITISHSEDNNDGVVVVWYWG